MALQLVEKTARLALASLAPRKQITVGSNSPASAYSRDEPEDADSDAKDSGGFGFNSGSGGAAGRPELLWNGPSPRAAVAWGGGGGGGHSRPAIGH